jgi:lactate dehydrogenase-like 2-hydroxyacid dehydrogenase
MSSKPRLVAVSPMPEAVVARIISDYDADLSQDRNRTVEELDEAARLHRADAVLVSARVKLDAAAIAALPETVKIIATYSVGYDHIDLSAARLRGIPVTNTPNVLTDATADLSFLLLLGACRRASEYARIMQDGWGKSFGLADMLGTQVSGKTLGIVGMGRIGQAVARRARGFDMNVIYADQHQLPAESTTGAKFYSDIRAMLPRCDILSLHAPASSDGRPTMTRDMFDLLPRGAVFVNAARGKLVDEDALIDALRSGHLFAAGLDVFGTEPSYDLRFRELPNVFMTPHMGSATVETRNAMGFRALDNIDAALQGRAPEDRVN